MSKTFQTMTDKQLAFHHAVWIQIGSVAVLAVPVCFILGIWIDWRWFPTTAVAVATMVWSLMAAAFVKEEEERRKLAGDG